MVRNQGSDRAENHKVNLKIQHWTRFSTLIQVFLLQDLSAAAHFANEKSFSFTGKSWILSLQQKTGNMLWIQAFKNISQKILAYASACEHCLYWQNLGWQLNTGTY